MTGPPVVSCIVPVDNGSHFIADALHPPTRDDVVLYLKLALDRFRLDRRRLEAS